MKSEQILKVDIKATFQDVNVFCDKAEKLLRKNNLDDYIFAVQLMLREALTNAVVHGCRMNSGLIIKSTVLISKKEIIIEIEDPGEGFDWKACENRDYLSSAESGRGLLILEKYADEYEYNTSGNIVIIKKKIVLKE